ncbi:hypothetical protein DRP04_05540 [Archaeoglobales archaeon]|nr:MAG: hypothetical protein DRP04_05540 [Archaeoglobales archaeon]
MGRSETKAENKEEFIRIHYIGKGLYSIKDFKREAKKYGVARALPPSIVKTLKWGDKIYLAQHKDGKAIIFGYFVVEGINYTGSNRLKQAVRNDERLKVVREVSVNAEVRRRCGSYHISSTTYVDNELKELVEIIEDNAVIKKDYGSMVEEIKEQFKIFVTGKFYETPIVHVEAPFSRSIVKVPVSKFGSNVLLKVKADGKAEKAVAYLHDYKQRKRLTKRDKAALASEEITSFVEG